MIETNQVHSDIDEGHVDGRQVEERRVDVIRELDALHEEGVELDKVQN